MTDNFNYSQIQNIIGYSFKDRSLLRAAFCHSSRSVYGEEGNERLIFLGRALLDLVLSDYIYSRFPFTDEDELNKQLRIYRDKADIKKYISDRRLEKHILLSELSEALRTSETIHFQVFLSLCAAIYRDGGMPSLKGFIMPLLRLSDNESRYAPRVEKKIDASVTSRTKPNTGLPQKNLRRTEAADSAKGSFIRDALTSVSLSYGTYDRNPEKTGLKKDRDANAGRPDGENYKSMLQELVQRNLRTANVLLSYNTSKSVRGNVMTEIILDGRVISTGNGETKKESERDAAKNAYELLTDRKSDMYIWFSSLSENTVSIPERREDYVSKLNQYYQRLSRTSSAPVSYEKRQTQERGQYCVAVIADGKELASGTAQTLKEAKQNAAEEACRVLGI